MFCPVSPQLPLSWPGVLLKKKKMNYFKPADLSLPWHVEAMASKTTTNMAAIVGLGRVASQVTLLEPEPALYSPAWSRDQS